jgi:Mg/Co/Ni transporter MgtE
MGGEPITHVTAEELSEALGAPYMDVGFLQMVRKRAGWLSALFLAGRRAAACGGRRCLKA